VQTGTRSAQAQQSRDNDGLCGGLEACFRGPPRKRNASKIGTVLTGAKVFV